MSDNGFNTFWNLGLKIDDREPKNGWAKGTYHCTCGKCGDDFMGDKRAVRCADCAYCSEAGCCPFNDNEEDE
ncbi:MAG: hypothetical protein RIE52_12015 [Balneola sp.]